MAGRQWKRVKWEISAPVGKAASIALMQPYFDSLGNSTSEIVEIPASLLTPTQYRFTLSVTNWFGESSIFSVITEVSSNTDTPTVLILGAQPLRVKVMVRTYVLTCLRTSFHTRFRQKCMLRCQCVANMAFHRFITEITLLCN